MPNANAPGTTGGARVESSSGGSSRSAPSVSVNQPTPEAVSYILAAVEANGGVAEVPVFAGDATQVSELTDGDLGEPWDEIFSELSNEAETISFEDLFDTDLSGQGYEYVGTMPLLNEKDKGEFSDLDAETQDDYPDEIKYTYGDPDNGLKAYIPVPEWLDAAVNDLIHDGCVSDATGLLNAYYFPEIKEQLLGDEGGRLVVGIGRNSNHTDENGEADEFSKRRHVSFSIEHGSSSAKRVVNAAERHGTISTEDKESWQEGELDLDDIVNIIKQKRGF